MRAPSTRGSEVVRGSGRRMPATTLHRPSSRRGGTSRTRHRQRPDGCPRPRSPGCSREAGPLHPSTSRGPWPGLRRRRRVRQAAPRRRAGLEGCRQEEGRPANGVHVSPAQTRGNGPRCQEAQPLSQSDRSPRVPGALSDDQKIINQCACSIGTASDRQLRRTTGPGPGSTNTDAGT